MSKNFGDFKNIKEVLRSLIEQRVTLVLESGQKLTVEIDAVVDDLLVASVNGKILFVNIECICVVVTCCEEALEAFLNNNLRTGREEESRSRGMCGF